MSSEKAENRIFCFFKYEQFYWERKKMGKMAVLRHFIVEDSKQYLYVPFLAAFAGLPDSTDHLHLLLLGKSLKRCRTRRDKITLGPSRDDARRSICCPEGIHRVRAQPSASDEVLWRADANLPCLYVLKTWLLRLREIRRSRLPVAVSCSLCIGNSLFQRHVTIGSCDDSLHGMLLSLCLRDRYWTFRSRFFVWWTSCSGHCTSRLSRMQGHSRCLRHPCMFNPLVLEVPATRLHRTKKLDTKGLKQCT